MPCKDSNAVAQLAHSCAELWAGLPEFARRRHDLYWLCVCRQRSRTSCNCLVGAWDAMRKFSVTGCCSSIISPTRAPWQNYKIWLILEVPIAAVGGTKQHSRLLDGTGPKAATGGVAVTGVNPDRAFQATWRYIRSSSIALCLTMHEAYCRKVACHTLTKLPLYLRPQSSTGLEQTSET
jgi:hypothetical protein